MSFSFGTPSSAPATTGLTGGFSFGANKPATPGFGLAATSQPSTGLFGTPAATAAPAFGTTPAFGSTTPAFGAPAATPAFGAPAGSTPAFGVAAPAFGTSSAAPAFGTSTPAFGTAGTTPAFGATSTPAFGATSSAPAFGVASSAPTFGTTPAFGTGTTPAFGTGTTPAFGAGTTPAFGASSTSLGAGLGTGGLNFGAGTITSAPSTGLNFGTTSTASAGLGGLGGFGFGTSTAQTGLGAKLGSTSVAGTQLSTSVTSSLGLGGVAPAGTANTTQSDGKTEPPMQMKLPNEISTTVDSFKEFVKKQKSLSSEVMRISMKPLHKVSREADSLTAQALALAGCVSRARAQGRRLRAHAAAAQPPAERASTHTHNTELEGAGPPAYVKDLISELEQHLITLRRQMDIADKQMQASPKLLTEQELTLGIRRMHESLVALAGRLQAAHAQVEAQKEQYLNLRKYVLKDPTNVFENPSPSTSLDQILRDVEGARKKSKSSLGDVSAGGAALSDPRAVLGNMQQLAGPSPFTYFGNTLSSFASGDTSGANWQPPAPQPAPPAALAAPEPGGLQLQKPPGKRGKQ